MDHLRRVALTVCSFVSTCLFCVSACADVFTYDASLGTFPSAQGWTLEESTSGVNGDAAHNVVKENVYQLAAGVRSLTGDDRILYNWSVSANAFNFNSFDATVLEARLQVDHSDTFTTGGMWQTGYSLMMTDELDRHLILGIGESGVRLTNSINGEEANSTSLYTLDTTVGPITYKIVARNGMARVYINGSEALRLVVGLPQASDRDNTFRFGDFSASASSVTTTQFVSATTVPEPSSLVLLAGMMSLGFFGWRRRLR